jgi:hypothetical protein
VKVSFSTVRVLLESQVKLGFGTGIVALFNIILSKANITIRRVLY